MKIYEVDYFKRLTTHGRLVIWRRYTNEARRFNAVFSQYEVLLKNKQGESVWIPVNYCIRSQFTGEQLDEMRLSLE